ncbi:MAG: hypothetical protein K6E51_05020 [Treponema sp.]|nr:hypothetical protein [Treponema sp.]
MMCSMYCDPIKNIVMFLPDGTTDAEILSLAAMTFPDEGEETNLKPTGFIDLYNEHATYSLNDMLPEDVSAMPFSL